MSYIAGGILEGLGKAVSDYGSGKLQHMRDIELAEKKGPNPLEQILQMLGVAVGGGNMGNVNANVGASVTPQPGEVVDGYRFKGGNPNDQNSWEPI